MIRELFDEGLSYNKIAKLMEMPKSTVAAMIQGALR